MKFVILMLFILSPFLSARESLLYGEDGRFEIDSFYAHQYKEMSRAVAGKVKRDRTWRSGDKFRFAFVNLEMSGVSSKVPFSRQALLIDCTGFLVAEDIMVTAGHCILDQNDCSSSQWLFDYTRKEASDKQFKISNTVGCKEIISRKFIKEEGVDFAIIRLSRKIKDRTPLRFRTNGEIEKDTPVVMIGHPLGLPMKLTKGANVWHIDEDWTFSANLDAFGGNSGSPVINENTGLVEGILVRGGADFHDLENGKLMVNLCDERSDEDGCGYGEDVTRITKLNLSNILK